jgi:iron complex outermembrane receptor protein
MKPQFPFSPKPLAAAIALLLPLSLAGQATAQQAPEEAEAASLDRVQVTGSRIRRSQVEGQSPVMTISREQIENTGLSSIADVLQELTTGGSALNTRLNSSGNFGFPPDGSGVGAGAATVDLRHLGANRVLVLVDGLRWVNESSASGVGSAVDLNTIPIAMIERIEILEDGASSIYGTDAIGGVVNIITRTDFQGASASVQYGQYDEGDGETVDAQISFGGRSDRLSYFFSASYTDQSQIDSGDRSISSFPVPGTGLTRGSSGTPRGRFIFVDPNTGQTIDGTLRNPVSGLPVYDPDDPFGAGTDFIPFSNDERFNFSPFNLLLTPNERTSLFTNFEYRLTDRVSLWGRVLYNERESTNRAAPEPIFLGPGAGTGSLADGVSIDASNPFNPFGFNLDADSNFILLGRRPLEAGPRIFRQDVETIYLSGGARGDFNIGDRPYYWDINFVNTETDARQTTRGSFNIARIAQALGPVDGCVGAANGCVPLDLFSGAGGITSDMLDFISFFGVDTSNQEMTSISANITGDLFDLPAGAVGFAGGYEYRDLSGRFQPDSVIVAGESNGVPALPTAGGYDVNELYGEVVIPLLSDLPGVQQFDFTAALRYSDFDTFGSETTTKFGVRWSVTDDLLLRGSFAEGFRAPGIGELFGSASRFDAVLNDLCTDFNNSGVSQDIINNCVALGVPADGSFVQVNPQISVTTGGNRELEPETSDSYMLGGVYSPSWVDRLSWASRLDFGITWYRHEIDSAIQAIDAQTQLNACIRTLNNAFCDGISRASVGGINGFNNRLTNIGGIETDGFDFNLGYASPSTGLGQFEVTWNTTFVNEFDELLLDPADPSRLAARDLVALEENDSAIPEWQSNLLINWKMGAWSANWTMRYIDGVTEVCSDFLDGTANSLTNLGLCSNPDFDDNGQSTNSIGSTTYHNVQLGWTTELNDFGLDLTAGVRNLFDRDPPVCLSCSLNGFDVTTHELPGQFWYLRAGLRF